MTRTLTGGCHCGAVRYEVDVEALVAVECNCSICAKKGVLHVLVDADRFRLLKGEGALSTYTFNTGVAQHHFCRRCGIHSFNVPRSNPDGFSVNARCLEGVELSDFTVEPFDGRRWEDNVSQLRGD